MQQKQTKKEKEKNENQVKDNHTCTPRCIWSLEAEVLSAASCSTSLHVAGLAEETVVQRVAALLRGLDGQQHHAVLTPVAIFMEVSSHAFNFEGIFPIARDDGILTDAAHRSEFPVEVIQAVHLILVVQGETLVPDATGTGHTREAGRVEGLAQGPDDVVLNHLTTLATLLQGVLVAGLTEGPAILLEEALPSQLAAACTTGEALGMVLPLHGLHGQLVRGHGLVAEGTDVCGHFPFWSADRFLWRRGPQVTGWRLRLKGLRRGWRWRKVQLFKV